MLKTAVAAARAAASVSPTEGSPSIASRSSGEPTIAGAAMSRMAAPVVAPNRSTISWARVGRGARRRYVDHDGAAQPEAVGERVLQLDEASGGMDDLDADGRLSQGPVEEPAPLEATDAKPLTDLVLGEVQPVVELGSTEHEPGLTRERLARARGRRADRHAQMCRVLLMCCSPYPRRRIGVKGLCSSWRHRGCLLYT